MSETPFTLVVHIQGGVVQGIYSNGPILDLVTVYLQDDDEYGPAVRFDPEIDPDYIDRLLESED